MNTSTRNRIAQATFGLGFITVGSIWTYLAISNPSIGTLRTAIFCIVFLAIVVIGLILLADAVINK